MLLLMLLLMLLHPLHDPFQIMLCLLLLTLLRLYLHLTLLRLYLLLILLHPLHNPLRMMLRILLLTLLRLHLLLHLKLRRHVHTSLDRWSLLDRLQPLLQLRERLGLHTSPFGPVDPREATEVCYSEFATDKPQPLVNRILIRKSVVQDFVEAFRFCLVAVDGVVDLLWSVAVEVVRCR